LGWGSANPTGKLTALPRSSSWTFTHSISKGREGKEREERMGKEEMRKRREGRGRGRRGNGREGDGTNPLQGSAV